MQRFQQGQERTRRVAQQKQTAVGLGRTRRQQKQHEDEVERTCIADRRHALLGEIVDEIRDPITYPLRERTACEWMLLGKRCEAEAAAPWEDILKRRERLTLRLAKKDMPLGASLG